MVAVVTSRFTGLAAWVVQRGSAVYMLAFGSFAAVSLAVHPRVTFAEWSGWVHGAGVSTGAALFFLALFGHMWVGLRDVLLDYAKPAWLQQGLLLLLAATLASLWAWALVVLFGPSP